jgi:alpha,alpha-trehalase
VSAVHPAAAGHPPHVLREYAFLADGERGALIGPRGDVVWLCAPRWDDDAVLSALVGGRGAYAVTPVDPYVWGGYYEPGTLIWRSRWVTTRTEVECREALAFPGDPHRTVLLRRIEAVDRDVRVAVELDVRAGFGSRSLRHLERDEAGRWTARTGDLRVRWSGAPDATVQEDGRLCLDVDVRAGHAHDLVLEISDAPLPEPVDPAIEWSGTERAWAAAVPDFRASAGPTEARHAYAVLRGLTGSAGGMVAAATLGLPERAERGRNYDYRYVWVRDQCYAGLAVAADGPHELLDDAVAFTTGVLLEAGPAIAPAYRPAGGEVPPQRTLPLPGYPGGVAVVGNGARDQFQLDAVGEILQLLAAAGRHDRLDSRGWRAVQVATKVIEERWTEPDAGIWELHDAWWTQSRLACIAGLRAAAQIGPPGAEANRMLSLADAILAETSARCLHPAGYWRRCPGQDGTDAALVLPPVRGALPADDPRTTATLAEVGAELVQDGYVYRFAPDRRALGEAEGAFLLCGFLMAQAHWQQGDEVGAFRWFERNRAACGPPALLAEEYDVTQRQLRGNLPQAFVHAALLETSVRLGATPEGNVMAG